MKKTLELILSLKNPSKLSQLKEVTKALGNYTRLSILGLIANDTTGNLNYGVIAKKIKKSPTAITNHMGLLRRCNLIEDMIVEGKRGKMQKLPQLKYDKIIIELK